MNHEGSIFGSGVTEINIRNSDWIYLVRYINNWLKTLVALISRFK